MALVNIQNENEFNEKVLSASQAVLVDFWAPWCGPCKMVGPEVEALANDYADKAVVVKVNVDEQKSLASKYNVMSIPTLIVFKDGQEAKRIVGFRPKKELGAVLDSVM
ncbi:Thioredoxin [bioreactor metagenome]|uniref:Thioredoxin n=1 Tax=bioreactor metagenome TaxID=1076179 RepID=A0A644T8P3_9ZZZZ|nr:thioredoxin [Negativicutes bacterium]